MRLLLLADTHGLLAAHAPAWRGQYDLVIHAGDLLHEELTPTQIQAECEALLSLAGGAPVVLVPGNHDRALRGAVASGRLELEDGVIQVLSGAGAVIGGLNLWGEGHSLTRRGFLSGGAPGEDDRGAAHWAQIPADTHLLITHSPPLGLLDHERQHWGSRGLAERLRALKLRAHVFGHVHGGAGLHLGRWLSVNAAQQRPGQQRPGQQRLRDPQELTL